MNQYQFNINSISIQYQSVGININEISINMNQYQFNINSISMKYQSI